MGQAATGTHGNQKEMEKSEKGTEDQQRRVNGDD